MLESRAGRVGGGVGAGLGEVDVEEGVELGRARGGLGVVVAVLVLVGDALAVVRGGAKGARPAGAATTRGAHRRDCRGRGPGRRAEG